MGWSRFDFRQYYEPYKTYFTSKLKPVAYAIHTLYQSEPITHFKEGLTQIARVPSFLKNAPETHQVMLDSLYSNVVEYIIPIVFYRRAMGMLLESSPDWATPLVHTLDGLLMLSYLSRLALRRTLDNILYPVHLLRTTANDLDAYLPILLSKLLAQTLADSFIQIFINEGMQGEIIFFDRLYIELYSLFKGFFKQSTIQAETFDQLKHPLEKIIFKILLEQDVVDNSNEEEIEEFAKLIAKVIIYHLANAFHPLEPITLEQLAIKLQKNLEKTLMRDSAANKTQLLLSRIHNLVQDAKPFLPIHYIESCSCTNPKKRIHGALAGPIYATGNLLFLSLPDVLDSIIMFRPAFLSLTRAFFFYMRLLMYGHSLNEYKVTGCTRHRYQIFAKNKMNSLGLGSSVLLFTLLHYGVNLISANGYRDNYYTPHPFEDALIADALLNVALQFGIISALAFKEPLLGKSHRPWDIFSFFRYRIRNGVTFITQLYDNGKKDYNACYADLKKIISSPYFITLADWLLKGYDLYPKAFSKLALNHYFPALLPPSSRNATNAPSYDLTVSLFQIKTIEKTLRLFEKEITMGLYLNENLHLHSISKWIGGPLLSLPLPGLIASLITLPLLCLQDDSLLFIVEKIREEILRIAVEKNIIIVELESLSDSLEEALEAKMGQASPLRRSYKKQEKFTVIALDNEGSNSDSKEAPEEEDEGFVLTKTKDKIRPYLAHTVWKAPPRPPSATKMPQRTKVRNQEKEPIQMKTWR